MKEQKKEEEEERLEEKCRKSHKKRGLWGRKEYVMFRQDKGGYYCHIAELKSPMLS